MDFLLSPRGNCGVGFNEEALATLLGGRVMSINASPAETPAEEIPSADRALALLVEALAILDALDFSPEIGARLQEVITQVEKQVGSN